jgi:hypothetical protein
MRELVAVYLGMELALMTIAALILLASRLH